MHDSLLVSIPLIRSSHHITDIKNPKYSQKKRLLFKKKGRGFEFDKREQKCVQ